MEGAPHGGTRLGAINVAQTIRPASLAKGGQRPFVEQTFYYSQIPDCPN